MPSYPRPYLVVNSSEDSLYLLNVSSIKKKSWKLNKVSNKQISNHFPPFPYPSFVKMDYVYQISKEKYLETYLMDNGSVLHIDSLKDIVDILLKYQNKELYKISKEQIFQLNTIQ